MKFLIADTTNIYSSQVDKNSKKILKRYSDTARISDRGYFTFIHPKSLDGADNFRDWIELNKGANFVCRTAQFKYFLSTGRSAEILNPSLKCSYPGISYDR